MSDKPPETLKVVELQPDTRVEEVRQYVADLFNSVQPDGIVEVLTIACTNEGAVVGWAGIEDRFRIVGLLEQIKAELLASE